MKVLETRVYRGPNLYALWPVIRLRLDLGELEWFPTIKLPGFSARLVELIPSLSEHTCSFGEPSGFIRRMNEDDGTWLGHVLEHVTLELQCLAGTPVTFGKTRGHGLPPGQYHVVYTYVEEAVGVAAGQLALRIIHHLLPRERAAHDPTPLDFQAELEALQRLAREHALEPSTAALVEAAEKRGIPWLRLDDDRSLVQLGHGRHQRRIDSTLTSTTSHIAVEIASDPRLTRRILDQLGLPVLREASAGEAPPDGNDFRILVVGDRVVAVAQRDAGTVIDRTDEIHEDNRIMAERAASALGLEVAGIDFVSPDISRSFREVGGLIVAVNAAPNLGIHLTPSKGVPQDVAGPVIDQLFPPGAPSCIPIAAITGTNGKTTTTRMVGHILKLAGHTVGMTTSDGVYIDGKLTVRGDMTGPWSSQLVLRDPSVDAAVLETARGGIVRSGLGWRRCNVGAVLNVASDHLGLGGIKSLDDLAAIKQVIVEVAEDACVLNADDERVVRMAEHSPAKPIWVTMDPANQRVRRHVRRGGRAVTLEPGINGRLLVLYEGEEQAPLLWARQIPATLEGRALHNIQNALFAAAVATGLGVAAEFIREGLRTFSLDFAQVPGRLNLYDQHPFQVLLDYAHNAHGMEAVAHTVRELTVPGRRIGVIAAPGDRRDEDILALAAAASTAFDLFFLREDDDLRGRRFGEVGEILRRGLLDAGVPGERIVPGVYGEEEAVLKSLEAAQEGDLVVIFGDELFRCWDQIVGFKKDTAEAYRELRRAAG